MNLEHKSRASEDMMVTRKKKRTVDSSHHKKFCTCTNMYHKCPLPITF